MRALLSILFVFSVLGSSFARVGETESQCNGRYGTPKTDNYTVKRNKEKPLLPVGYTKSYDYHGWNIRVAYIAFNGPAIRMSFRKKTGGTIKDDELVAILTANTPEGMKWERGVYTSSPLKGSAGFFGNIGSNAMGGAAWKRTDGVIAVLEPLKMELFLESPAAVEILKNSKDKAEAHRKAEIPSF